MNKAMIIISYFTLALTTAFLGLILFWLFYPYNPIDFNETPFKVNTKIVKQGGVLSYNVDYCKYTTQEPTVKREFVDGIIFEATDTRAKVTQGCRVAISNSVVPATLPPSNYTMRVTVEYQVNPIRTITYINETEQFKVIERGSE